MEANYRECISRNTEHNDFLFDFRYVNTERISLQEMVVPVVEEHASNRARSELKDEIPLSELLDLEIRWPSEAERILSSNSDSAALLGESSLDLAGVDLDCFFDRRESDSNVSEENSTAEKHVGAASENNFQANENLSLFQNVQASEASGWSVEDQSGDSFSGWEANFKSASSGPVHVESKSVDHSKVELDTVSIYGKDSVGVKKNDDFNPSASSEDDWFQGDRFRTSDSKIDGHSGKSETTMDFHNTKTAEIDNGSSNRNLDWMQDDQWQMSDTKIPDIVAADEEDDSWNDFTGSVRTQDPSGIISSSKITAQTGNLEFSADLSDMKTAEGANSSSNRDFDWMEDDQQQDNNNKTTDNVSTDEAADSFDAWNDFTGSATTQYSSHSVSNSEITDQTGKFEKNEDPNNTNIAESAVGSSSNFDWMQNDPWQGSNNKAAGIMTTNEVTNSFDAWNDFTSSAISQNPSSSIAHSEIKDQAGISEIPADLHDTKTESANASTVKSFDWMQDEQWQVSSNKPTDIMNTNDITDSFDVWSGFSSLTTRLEDPFSNNPLQAVNQNHSEKTFEMDLFGSSNNSHDMDFSRFSQHDILGQFDNQLSSSAATDTQPAAASSNRCLYIIIVALFCSRKICIIEFNISISF